MKFSRRKLLRALAIALYVPILISAMWLVTHWLFYGLAEGQGTVERVVRRGHEDFALLAHGGEIRLLSSKIVRPGDRIVKARGTFRYVVNGAPMDPLWSVVAHAMILWLIGGVSCAALSMFVPTRGQGPSRSDAPVR